MPRSSVIPTLKSAHGDFLERSQVAQEVAKGPPLCTAIGAKNCAYSNHL